MPPPQAVDWPERSLRDRRHLSGQRSVDELWAERQGAGGVSQHPSPAPLQRAYATPPGIADIAHAAGRGAARPLAAAGVPPAAATDIAHAASCRGAPAIHPTGLWPQLDEAPSTRALGPGPSAEFRLLRDEAVLDLLCRGSRDGRPTSGRDCRHLIHMLRLDVHDTSARMRAIQWHPLR